MNLRIEKNNKRNDMLKYSFQNYQERNPTWIVCLNVISNGLCIYSEVASFPVKWPCSSSSIWTVKNIQCRLR